MKNKAFRYLAALIVFACFASNAAGQTNPSTSNALLEIPTPVGTADGSQSQARSTGLNYFGVDLGLTYNWYSGGSNFFWPPIEQPINNDPNTGLPGTIASIAQFKSLGSGVGFVLGVKGGIALSNSVDIEGKLRYVTNYTSASESGDSIPIAFPTARPP